jgi:hypothetical protein
MRRTHIKTKTGVIVVALEELLRRHSISGTKEDKGKIEPDIDSDRFTDRGCGC